MHELTRPDLIARSHKLAQSDTDFTNDVVLSIPITIDHHQLEVLLLLEEVWESETGFEVRIQIVFHLLSEGDLLPIYLPLGLLNSLKQDAPGVRLRCNVPVFKATPRHI